MIVYMDNLLIYSDNPDQHCQHIQEVLQQLCANNLYANVDKCKWHKDTIKYVGYILFA